MNNNEALCKLRSEFDELINKFSLSELCSPELVKKALKLELLLSTNK